METIYLICACVGGTLLVCQLVAGLLGLGGHHGDVAGHDLGGADHGFDHGHAGDQPHGGDQDKGSSRYLTLLSLRTITAALAFFGLVGMVGHTAGQDAVQSLLTATAAGAAAFGIVAYLMNSLHRLHADGTVRIERAVGRTATVYLRVPARRAGAGKVHLNLQNRTVEYQAVTTQDELPTGSKAVVVAVLGPDTVEVVLAPTTTEAPAHV